MFELYGSHSRCHLVGHKGRSAIKRRSGTLDWFPVSLTVTMLFLAASRMFCGNICITEVECQPVWNQNKKESDRNRAEIRVTGRHSLDGNHSSVVLKSVRLSVCVSPYPWNLRGFKTNICYYSSLNNNHIITTRFLVRPEFPSFFCFWVWPGC